jgi:hypothetical protein
MDPVLQCDADHHHIRDHQNPLAAAPKEKNAK